MRARLEALLQLLILLAGNFEACSLLLQVGGVVASYGLQASAVDFTDPLRDVIEEVTIVSHGEDCAGVSSEVLLEPQDRFGVEVVGGLIEEQQVGACSAAACRAQRVASHHRRGG